MNRFKKKYVLIAAIVVVVLVTIVYGGFLYSVNSDGESRQQALQSEYNSLSSSIGRCMQDNSRETSFTDAEIDNYHSVLVVVALTEFVDIDGNAIERTPDVVLHEVIDAMAVWGNFTLNEVTGLSELVVMCGGTYSQIYNSAVEFQNWIDEGSRWDRMIRQKFPTQELDVNVISSYSDDHLVGPGALDWLTRTVNLYTGSSLDVVPEDD